MLSVKTEIEHARDAQISAITSYTKWDRDRLFTSERLQVSCGRARAICLWTYEENAPSLRLAVTWTVQRVEFRDHGPCAAQRQRERHVEMDSTDVRSPMQTEDVEMVAMGLHQAGTNEQDGTDTADNQEKRSPSSRVMEQLTMRGGSIL